MNTELTVETVPIHERFLDRITDACEIIDQNFLLNNVCFYVSDNIDYTCKPEFWPDNVVFSSEYQINRMMSKKDARIARQRAYQMRGYNLEGTKIKKEVEMRIQNLIEKRP